MGACFDSVKIPVCSKEELKNKFRDIQEDYCAESGNDTYAGHIGIVNGLTITSKL
jgi:hypothetical protein